MKKIIYFMMLTVCMLLAVSCKKAMLTSYDLAAGITIYKNGLTNAVRDSVLRSFAILDQEQSFDTVRVPLRIAGLPAAYDRVISFKVVDSLSTATADHYDILPVVIPADSYVGELQVKLNKTPDMAEQEFRIALSLVDSEDFAVASKELSSYLIRVNNYLTKPASWNDFRFGEYSQVKYGLIIRETGYSDYARMVPELLFYIAGKLRNYLIDYEKENGYELVDEKGLPVRFP